MASAETKPTLLLLSLASKPWFDEMYDRLVQALLARCNVKKTKKAASAITIIDNDRPDFVFVTDEGIAEEQGRDIAAKLNEYVRGGGTVIIGAMFSSFVRPDDAKQFFKGTFDLPWEFGDYHRTTVHLNQRATGRLPSKLHLQPAYSQKAVFLMNVDPAAAVYLPSRDSETESLVFPAAPIANQAQTPVAWTKLGDGYLGYIGDVNQEQGSDEVILSMCGF